MTLAERIKEAKERMIYWRHQHELWAQWIDDGRIDELRARNDQTSYTSEFHRDIAVADYDYWISVLEDCEEALDEA